MLRRVNIAFRRRRRALLAVSITLAATLALLLFVLRMRPIAFRDDIPPTIRRVVVRGEFTECSGCPLKGAWYAVLDYSASMRENETTSVIMYLGISRVTTAPSEFEVSLFSSSLDIAPNSIVIKKDAPFPQGVKWLLTPRREGHHVFAFDTNRLWGVASRIRYVKIDGSIPLNEDYDETGGVVELPVTVYTVWNVSRRTADVVSWSIGLASFAFGLLGVADYLKERRQRRAKR
jgi:hypothetical protein